MKALIELIVQLIKAIATAARHRKPVKKRGEIDKEIDDKLAKRRRDKNSQ